MVFGVWIRIPSDVLYALQTSIEGWIVPQLASIYSSCIHAYREQKVLGILELRLEEIRKPWYQHDNTLSIISVIFFFI